jgi:hypothetical protein
MVAFFRASNGRAGRWGPGRRASPPAYRSSTPLEDRVFLVCTRGLGQFGLTSAPIVPPALLQPTLRDGSMGLAGVETEDVWGAA